MIFFDIRVNIIIEVQQYSQVLQFAYFVGRCLDWKNFENVHRKNRNEGNSHFCKPFHAISIKILPGTKSQTNSFPS